MHLALLTFLALIALMPWDPLRFVAAFMAAGVAWTVEDAYLKRRKAPTSLAAPPVIRPAGQ